MISEIKKRPRYNRWYKVPLPQCVSGDGSGYHFYISRGHSRNLLIFFAGGGVAWDSHTAAHPTEAVGVLTGDRGFYWANLRPVTEFMNINQGITENRNKNNYFNDWNMAVITYSTGDFHIGRAEFPYDDKDPEKIMHFNGYNNYSEAIGEIKRIFPEPVNLLLAGDSAGGFGVAALADDIIGHYDPERSNITICSDSSLLPWKDWKRVMKELWNTKPEIYERLNTDNPVTDWFRALYEKYGSGIRYLFTCSIRDEILSSYWNYMKGKAFETDEEAASDFEKELKQMVYDLTDITPEFCFYFNDFRLWQTGTLHTCIRNPLFFTGKMDGINMHDWLKDMICGEHYSVGMGFLSSGF